jgi:nucleotide-binding universal stress UspA family protein
MKPIVLATDGSPSAAEATMQAVELARALDAPLVAVGVEHVDVPSYGYYGYANLVAELTKVEREHVDETLAQAKAVATEAGITCDVVHAIGPTAEAICTVARKWNAQMIVRRLVRDRGLGERGGSPCCRLRRTGMTQTTTGSER